MGQSTWSRRVAAGAVAVNKKTSTELHQLDSLAMLLVKSNSVFNKVFHFIFLGGNKEGHGQADWRGCKRVVHNEGDSKCLIGQ